MKDFVHLHLHSNYSLLDGFVDFKSLFQTLKEMGMERVALTDHGVMYGALQFYEEAKKAGIQPIIGCEVYTSPHSHKDKNPDQDKGPFHLVLLAKDLEGYRNLMELVSIGFLQGFYYKPRIDLDLLEEYNQGLIALTGCLAGRLPQLILKGKREEALELLDRYRNIFDGERLYLELQDHGLPEQKEVNNGLIELGRSEGIPLVATNDVHYLKKEDAKIHDILLCLQTGKTLSEEKRLRFPNHEFYLKDLREMESLFSHVPDALENTLKIAGQCHLTLPVGEILLPEFPIPPGKEEGDYLGELCQEGLQERYGQLSQEMQERLHFELSVIKKMGFSSYFLIVWDFIRFARDEGISVGPGRGSAAGSLVAYALRITDLDPLEHGLLFERFLNPARVSMPDIDIDFCYVHRNKVIDYVTSKYGKGKVAQIVTFGTMAARIAIRDVGRVLEVPYGEVDRIARLVPESPGMTLEKALVESTDLKELYDGDERVKKIIDIAQKIQGVPRHSSTHAAGVVISPKKLTHFTPLQTSDEEVTTQYPMADLEKIGLLKMDFLGLRNLTIMHDTLLELERQGIKLDLQKLPLDDDKTYQLLQSGRSKGIFQLESKGMQNLLVQLKPDSFPDVVHLLALYRPGPLGSGMVKDFVERRHGRAKVLYPHPDLEGILKETYGVILYQEQVMKIANRMAGYTMAEGDELRRCMGKKKLKEMERHRIKFIQGSKERGFTKEKAEDIFDLMVYFAGYGFNKSHSAAYALLAYQTAYLKAHYQTPFFAALLSSIMDRSDKVALYIDDCKKMGINVLPPDINGSGLSFTVVGDNIRFGLKAIKNVGQKAIEDIIKQREEGPFISLGDFCKRVSKGKVTLKVVESLIKCGAMDSLKVSRSRLLAGLEDIYSRAQNREKEEIPGQLSFMDTTGVSFKVEEDLPPVPDFSHEELLQMEKELIGFYLSGHPLDPYRKDLEQIVDYWSNDLLELEGEMEKEVILGGIMVEKKIHRTKKGNREMAFISLEDWYGTVEVVVFPDLYQEVQGSLDGQQPLLVKGTLERQDENTWKMLPDTIFPLHELQERELFSLQLSLHLIGDNPPLVLDSIREVLRAHQGPSPVELLLELKEKRIIIAAGEDYSVKKTEQLVLQLEALKDGKVFHSLEWLRRRSGWN